MWCQKIPVSPLLYLQKAGWILDESRAHLIFSLSLRIKRWSVTWPYQMPLGSISLGVIFRGWKNCVNCSWTDGINGWIGTMDSMSWRAYWRVFTTAIYLVRTRKRVVKKLESMLLAVNREVFRRRHRVAYLGKSKRRTVPDKHFVSVIELHWRKVWRNGIGKDAEVIRMLELKWSFVMS